jgi:hypothetical protein
MSNIFLDTALMIFVGLISMLGSLFVATTIMFSKKLQAHPQTLIAYTCICEAISSFNGVIYTIGTTRTICYLDMHQLFSWSVLFSRDKANYNRMLHMLEASNNFSFQYFSLLTLFLNMCLCIDLILTLKNPFEPAKRRTKIYLALSGVICLPLAILTQNSFVSTNKNPDAKVSDTEQTSHLVLAMSLSVYMLIAIYSCIYASRRLARPSINKIIRKHFLRKHYYYVGIFIFVWGCYLAKSYYELFYPDVSSIKDPQKMEKIR